MLNKRGLLPRLSRVYDLISSIPVAGENADKIAEARNTLKAIYKELEPEHEFDPKGGAENGG